MSWGTINQLYKDVAPNVLRLVDLLLTIPATSAEAERGFSIMKMVKTDKRNRMQGASLNTLMRIVLLSPPEDLFEPLPAVHLWFEACRRRETVRVPAPVLVDEFDHDDYDNELEDLELDSDSDCDDDHVDEIQVIVSDSQSESLVYSESDAEPESVEGDSVDREI